MTNYAVSLGIAEPKVEFVDVYGLTDDLLSMVPQPLYALCLVYPITKASSQLLRAMIAAQEGEMEVFRKTHNLFFTRQTVPNACGTVGILHALMNNLDKLGTLAPGGILDRYRQVTERPGEGRIVDADKLGNLIGTDESLASAHAQAAERGVTQNQPIDTDINLHFVAFLRVGDRCVEFDGRYASPILHGKCDDSRSFLRAAADVVQARINMTPDAIEFGLTALVEKQA